MLMVDIWFILIGVIILFVILFIVHLMKHAEELVDNDVEDQDTYSSDNGSDQSQPEPQNSDAEIKDEPSESESVDTSDFRIKEEEVHFKAITESQREALIAANPKTKRTKSLTGIVIKVVGATYLTAAAKGIYCSLNIGDSVSLKLDPDNEYDDTAVKVMAKYNCIGYVPSEYSNAIYAYKWMDKFDKSYVIEPSVGNSLYGLKIVIFLKREKPEPSESQ